MKLNRPLNIYEVRCELCGNFLGLQRDAFRSETDGTGRKRYWHLPACPPKEVTQIQQLNAKQADKQHERLYQVRR